MTRLRHPVSLSLLLTWAARLGRSFSPDASFAARHPRLPSDLVRHLRPPSRHWITSGGYARRFPPRPPQSTVRWNSPKELDVPQEESATRRTPPDLHPPTLRAIAEALLVRAKNDPEHRLRFADDGSMEAWEITLAAGKIAQRRAEEWMLAEKLNPREDAGDEELLQVMSGRVVAVLTRLEELEEDLLNRCVDRGTMAEQSSDGLFAGLGVPEEELRAWRASEDDSAKRIADAAAAIDAVCLFDESLRYDRARTLLAMFLHEIEGPGLRRNGVVVPCMDVDFLSEDEWGVLFGSNDEEDEPSSGGDGTEASESASVAIDDSVEEGSDATEDAADVGPARPSLHPIAIDAIEDALRLRAQNSTTSPLRLIDAQTEWFEVQYNIAKFTERFLEKYTNAGKGDESQWTEEELQTVGGRVVGVLMRLDDLEWEWNHRVSTSSLADAGSPSMVSYDSWKGTLGLHAPHPETVEQVCIRTVDVALSEERDFARARAERMLALFLLNIEGPGLEASGNEVPGGSSPDFIEDALQLELMMPRPKKS